MQITSSLLSMKKAPELELRRFWHIKENQKIRYLPNAYGYSVEDVLELRQESTAKPKEIETLRDRFDRALNRSDYETAKEVVEKLCGILGEEHSEVKNAKEELDLNHWAEEN